MGAQRKSNQDEGRGQRSYDAPGRGPPTVFFGQTTIEAFLSPQRHRATLVSVRVAAQAILAFMEVICTMILPMRAAGLFFKPSRKSTFVAPHSRIWYCVWLIRTPSGHRGLGVSQTNTKGLAPLCHPWPGPLTVFFEIAAVGTFVSTGASDHVGVRARGHTRDFNLHRDD